METDCPAMLNTTTGPRRPSISADMAIVQDIKTLREMLLGLGASSP